MQTVQIQRMCILTFGVVSTKQTSVRKVSLMQLLLMIAQINYALVIQSVWGLS